MQNEIIDYEDIVYDFGFESDYVYDNQYNSKTRKIIIGNGIYITDQYSHTTITILNEDTTAPEQA